MSITQLTCFAVDWRLVKPKMHVQGDDDPSPDTADYASDVRCEHGNLTMNTSQRVRIGAQVRMAKVSERC